MYIHEKMSQFWLALIFTVGGMELVLLITQEL